MANTVYVIQDGLSATNLGGASGKDLYEFSAPSLAAAQNFAQYFSTGAQRGVSLVQRFGGIGASVYTYAPSTGLLVSALSSGISY